MGPYELGASEPVPVTNEWAGWTTAATVTRIRTGQSASGSPSSSERTPGGRGCFGTTMAGPGVFLVRLGFGDVFRSSWWSW